MTNCQGLVAGFIFIAHLNLLLVHGVDWPHQEHNAGMLFIGILGDGVSGGVDAWHLWRASRLDTVDGISTYR